MASAAIYFGRKYRLTFEREGEGKTVFEVEDGKPAMDIKFDVTYARGQTAREGTISILGLGHKTIHKFIKLSAMGRGLALNEHLRVKLEAGYFTSAGMVEILNGFAFYATVTSPPQMWLTIKVSEYDPMSGLQISLPRDFTNKSMSWILETLCLSLTQYEGYKFDWDDKTQEQLIYKDTELKTVDFGDQSSLSQIMVKLNTCMTDKVQFVLSSTKSDDTRIIEGHDIAPDKVTQGVVPVDGENGLLSVTGIDAVGGCVTTFLDGRYPDELCHLELKSILNQQADGRYYIIKKQYVGHFMGQEWYTRYFCSAREKD